MRVKTALALFIATFLATTSVRAQEAAPEGSEEATSEGSPQEATPEGSPQEATPEASASAEADGGRFRFGINGTAGLESVSAGGASVSGAMFGLDVRLGWQFSHLLAIYVQPHLSFGSLSSDEAASAGVSGFTGTVLVTAMGEVTFLDRFFGGAGFGYGVFNNPSGFALDFKLGGYPIVSRDENGIRRTGLMAALDFRTVFLDGATGLLIMGCLGYESF